MTRMTPLEGRVLDAITRESLIPDRGRVLVALSGGADSVALTRLLVEVAAEGGFSVAGVIHLNHQLRPDAGEDESFCRALARQLSVPIVVGTTDVRAKAAHDGTSVEEAGHRARRSFFVETAAAQGADRVATAHTRHDLAETFLMRLLRGAGPVGLSGIHPRSGLVIRPLLDVARRELREYLDSIGQSFREDESNFDLSITRNRVRHELIPLLEERFSPSVVDTLVREASIARYDAEWLERAANEAARSVVTSSEGTVMVDRAGLARQPPALARRIVKRALEEVTGRGTGFDQIERVLTLAADTQGESRVWDLPGCRVSLLGERIVIGPPHPRSDTDVAVGFARRLPVPGEVEVPEAGVAVSASRVRGGRPPSGLSSQGDSVLVDGRHLSEPLVVRNWRPGDVFRPLGLGGRKKLQDLFVDRKVERAFRHKIPIVADETKGIVWVVGHTVADDFRVTADTEGMLLLKAWKLAES